MKYKVVKMSSRTPIMKDNKIVGEMEGYAFIDNRGNCSIIVYGERQMELMNSRLNK